MIVIRLDFDVRVRVRLNGCTLGLALECALLHCDLIRTDCDVDAIDAIDLDVAIELLMPYTWI